MVMTNAPQLDRSLIFLTKRAPRKNELTPEECIALNLFKRKGVSVRALCEAFRIGKNTAYYRSFTGNADSYPTSQGINWARDTNALIDELGEEEAYKRFVTPEQIRAVNAAMARNVERRRR